MATYPDYGELAAALAEPGGSVAQRALQCFRSSPLRMPRAPDDQAIVQLISPILEGLTEALSPTRTEPAAHAPAPPRLVPGSIELREAEKSAAFMGATLGAEGLSGFDTAALVFSLRDVLSPLVRGAAAEELTRVFEWLAILAVDSMATARERAAHEKLREDLETSTPVLLLTPELPAILLVARPDDGVVRSIFSRLLLLVVRVGAPAVIIDVSGMVSSPSDGFFECVERFLGHGKVRGRVETITVGVRTEQVERWNQIARDSGAVLRHEDYFDRAVARGVELSGYRLVRVTAEP